MFGQALWVSAFGSEAERMKSRALAFGSGVLLTLVFFSPEILGGKCLPAAVAGSSAPAETAGDTGRPTGPAAGEAGSAASNRAGVYEPECAAAPAGIEDIDSNTPDAPSVLTAVDQTTHVRVLPRLPAVLAAR